MAQPLVLGVIGVIPGVVLAVVVDHGPLLRPPHGRLLLRAELAGGARRRRRHGLAARRRGGLAAGDLEVSVARDEGLVAVVGLVAAAVGGPVGGVPDGAVGPHLAVGECVAGGARVAADGDVVDEEDDVVGVPEDGVVVEVGGGVEPEVEAHLAADDAAVAGAADVDVGLEGVGLAGDGAQELHVDLVVEPRVRLVVRQLQ